MSNRSIAGISLLYVALGLIAASVSAQSKAPGSTVDDIRHELLQLPYYGVFDFLSFKYDKGTVDLMGHAYRPALRPDAERAVKRVAGVDAVNDQVEELPVSIPRRRLASSQLGEMTVFRGTNAGVPRPSALDRLVRFSAEAVSCRSMRTRDPELSSRL